MSFTVGLAIFAGGLSVGLRAYIRSAAREERSVRETILLESAAFDVLARLAAGETVSASGATTVGGRRVESQVTPTSMRADLAADDAATLRHDGMAVGLSIDPEIAKAADGLSTLSAKLGLDASAEDCLRQVFTYGRGGQARAAVAPQAAIAVEPGDQVDLRLAIPGRPTTVLWLRARFTDARTGWSLHDYRRLQNVRPCEA